MHYLYRDGDNIDFFCKLQGDIVQVSDLGETMRWQRMQTVSPKRSTKQNALIQDVCLTHGVGLYRGVFAARCREGDLLAAVVTRVALAALRVSDLWFTFRSRSVESVTDEVADLLTDRGLKFTRGETFHGTLLTGGQFAVNSMMSQISSGCTRPSVLIIVDRSRVIARRERSQNNRHRSGRRACRRAAAPIV